METVEQLVLSHAQFLLSSGEYTEGEEEVEEGEEEGEEGEEEGGEYGDGENANSQTGMKTYTAALSLLLAASAGILIISGKRRKSAAQ